MAHHEDVTERTVQQQPPIELSRKDLVGPIAVPVPLLALHIAIPAGLPWWMLAVAGAWPLVAVGLLGLKAYRQRNPSAAEPEPTAQPLLSSGNFCGWVRAPGGAWEDMIGIVRIELEPAATPQVVNVQSVEFGLWRGCIVEGGRAIHANTDQGETEFRSSIRMESQSGKVRTVLDGALWAPQSRRLFEVRLVGDWR